MVSFKSVKQSKSRSFKGRTLDQGSEYRGVEPLFMLRNESPNLKNYVCPQTQNGSIYQKNAKNKAI